MPYKNIENAKIRYEFYNHIKKEISENPGYTLLPRLCLYCGAEFIPKSDKHLYDKAKCRQAQWRLKSTFSEQL